MLDVPAVGNPAADRYSSDGDAAAPGAGITAFFRAWSEPSLRAAFGLDDTAADRLYNDVAAGIAKRFTFGLRTITALIAKPR